MVQLSRIPVIVKVILQGMPSIFRHRHQLIFTWLIVMQIVAPGPKHLKGLSRWSPKFITEWRFRRLLTAAYWSVHVLMTWFAEQAIAAFPAPEDGTVYLIGDGSHKAKRGKKNSVVQKTKRDAFHGYFFGIRFIVLMVGWDVYRIPVDFALVLPKNHPDYQNENELFRQMIHRFSPPDWTTQVIVLGDAAFASKANMQLIQQRNDADQHSHQRRWAFVFGIARTWKMRDGKHLKQLVTHLPQKFYQKTWIPTLTNQRRHYFGVFAKTTSLNHIGDVTILLSKRGRNISPKNTKLIVTNLTEVTPRQLLGIYQRRWSIELLFKELKSEIGLGQHQITKEPQRVEKSLGMAFIAYLVLIRIQKHNIHSGKAWSITSLKQNMILDVITDQVRHSTQLKVNQTAKAA